MGIQHNRERLRELARVSEHLVELSVAWASALIEFGAKFRMVDSGNMKWKSSAATVKPLDFLSKAMKFGKGGPDAAVVEKYRRMIRAGEKIDMPQIWVERAGKGIGNHPSNFKVSGHEGRHRMVAAHLEKVKRVPVEVFAYSEARHPKRSPGLRKSLKMVRHFKPEGQGSKQDAFLCAKYAELVEFGEVAEKTNPDLWRAKVAAAKQKFGKWSARASQWAVGAYKGAGGGYRGEKSSSNSMAKWTRQKWRTRDGSKAERSDRKGRKVTARYLPDAKWKSLSPSEAAATDAKKRNASREGKQVVANTSKAKVRELARHYPLCVLRALRGESLPVDYFAIAV